MQVTKRNGDKEDVSFDKITKRIRLLAGGLKVEPIIVSKNVCHQIVDGIQTSEIDKISSIVAQESITLHPDYSILAGRISVSDLQKNTCDKFSDYFKLLSMNNMVDEKIANIVEENKDRLDSVINNDRDFVYNYFAYMTLRESYLWKIDGKTEERPQYMFMRVALCIHREDIESVVSVYEDLSTNKYIHASPTLYNSCSKTPQLASCFLLDLKSDSINGIYDTLHDCANISKWAGGIGLSMHKLRGNGSKIKGTNGLSTGLCTTLRPYNATARFVNQGGRRKGSFAIYLEVWHSDIKQLLDLRKNTGNEEDRCRDLFTGLWVCDLFMKRVKNNEMWSLFSSDTAPGLDELYGEEFEKRYVEYEEKGLYRSQVKASDLWYEIIASQIETGTPYMLYKDSCNIKSNQKNLGTIKSSNLCTEIIEYTSPSEIAVCNLASINLPHFYKDGKFDFKALQSVSGKLVRNLNKVIENTHYPVPEAKTSNMKHKPMGIGVQGLHTLFQMMDIPFSSTVALELNRDIFETIYYGAITESCKIAQEVGMTYDSYKGSPISEGILQFDMWPENKLISKHSEVLNYDWDAVKADIKKHGVYNSLLIAQMPTASTSIIIGGSESIDPISNNIYVRRVLSGEFTLVNKFLINKLISLNMWDDSIKNSIIANGGSIKHLDLDQHTKNVFATTWEISQKHVINLALTRSPFICQSQSMNLSLKVPNFNSVSSMHFYAWNSGLKTGMYYLRQQPEATAQQFTIDPTLNKNDVCTRDNPDCISCSS